ncbi:hypothetical protein A0H81_04546 [Grifola frondosa]|uniref:Uncharacterized protein n=1 Tax=Grifola frondosa TaxID=5627 RepID=A0A1C7ME74_GRIFR|nr:hypothetical protein A0H81_04546 [Grifola frondosa]
MSSGFIDRWIAYFLFGTLLTINVALFILQIVAVHRGGGELIAFMLIEVYIIVFILAHVACRKRSRYCESRGLNTIWGLVCFAWFGNSLNCLLISLQRLPELVRSFSRLSNPHAAAIAYRGLTWTSWTLMILINVGIMIFAKRLRQVHYFWGPPVVKEVPIQLGTFNIISGPDLSGYSAHGEKEYKDLRPLEPTYDPHRKQYHGKQSFRNSCWGGEDV